MIIIYESLTYSLSRLTNPYPMTDSKEKLRERDSR